MSMAISAILASVVRTLVASAYRIEEAIRQPFHIELLATRQDDLGVKIPYIIALCDGLGFTDDQLEELRTQASQQNRVLVLIAPGIESGTVSIDELFDRLGGEIPSWRALASDYFQRLEVLGSNSLPPGFCGEAWRHFEDAVNDGLEYLFARRVRRLGGGKRGSRFPDSVAPTPDGGILLVDSKAAKEGFDCTADNLRPIAEYATQQKRAQQGTGALSGCVLVSSSFIQPEQRLREIGTEFLADNGVPLSFLTTDSLNKLIASVQPISTLRSALRWKRTFCINGLIDPKSIDKEIGIVQTIRS